MLTHILDAEALSALVTLTVMEIVLGIDNVVFIAIVASRVKAEQQRAARSLGLLAALCTRVGLLFTLSWMMGLTRPFFSVLGVGISGRSLILIVGGLFLLGKATHEIHGRLEAEAEVHATGKPAKLGAVLVQIAFLDIVFSLDSVITAVGMAQLLWVMIAAMVISMLVMLVSAGPLSSFIEGHPTLKMLALSFLLLIGVVLVAEGLGKHIGKGYIYFAMAFSVFVELLNMRLRPKSPQPVALRPKRVTQTHDAAPAPPP
jgi:predicted tellurium resistance membrane protein TerC